MYIVTGESCMPCKMLKKWLAENNIEVEERLASSMSDKDISRLDLIQTPSLVLDDETVIGGLNPIMEYFEGEME